MGKNNCLAHHSVIPPTLTLPLSFDPEALDGEGGGVGGGDSLWLPLCRAATSVAKSF